MIIRDELEYNLRTIAGFLLVATGIAGSLYLGWWLIFRGNIIDIIHAMKMSLPGWVWIALKFSLTALCSVLFLSFFVLLAVVVFAGGRRRHSPVPSQQPSAATSRPSCLKM